MEIFQDFSARRFGCFLLWLSLSVAARVGGSDLDTVGVTQLRSAQPALVGTGIRVAQPEAGSPNWEVNPAAVGQPTSLFTYSSSAGTATNFPNALGLESAHANQVGSAFYGSAGGVAPMVAHADNYEATYFVQNVVQNQTAISAKIVNQSFVLSSLPLSLQQTVVDSAYDNYAARYNVLFISGAGNGGPVSAPATAYNGIAVGAFGGASSTGPTPDNSRSKPDLTAPAGFTSFSTPLVTGAAALLLQAALRGDGGAGTEAAAADPRTLKALLLNGAVKPADWTHGTSAPLDTRYGAGVVNVFNSYQHLVGGQQGFTDASSIVVGGAHPPTSVGGKVPVLRGWDFRTITSTVVQDRVHHYFFELGGSPSGVFIVEVTLAWNRQLNQTGINDLDLFLYDTRDNTLAVSSQSTVDNVEHLFVNGLKPGRYDLQVLKNGGLTKRVTDDETYALAFDFVPVKLGVAGTENQLVLSWPGSAMGYNVQSNPFLTQPNGWANLNNPVVASNGLNTVRVSIAVGNQFFRLQKP